MDNGHDVYIKEKAYKKIKKFTRAQALVMQLNASEDHICKQGTCILKLGCRQ